MRCTVGIAEMDIAVGVGDVIVTHALGSCLGLAVHDTVANVGGILHAMLPQSQINPEKAKANPFMFVDTGVPEFFRCLYSAGAKRERLTIKVAGGAAMQRTGQDRFNIGERNLLMLRKLLWKNNLLIAAQDVGGDIARTLYLEVGSGRAWISSANQEWDL
jgi:chemotaxis protein CheD